jgi:hypothetical protein
MYRRGAVRIPRIATLRYCPDSRTNCKKKVDKSGAFVEVHEALVDDKLALPGGFATQFGFRSCAAAESSFCVGFGAMVQSCNLLQMFTLQACLFAKGGGVTDLHSNLHRHYVARTCRGAATIAAWQIPSRTPSPCDGVVSENLSFRVAIRS